MSEPRDNRVPVMMSDAEIQAIDDWRFANRLSNRSEAIRRLCQLGLILDEQMDDISQGRMGAQYYMHRLRLAINAPGSEKPTKVDKIALDAFEIQHGIIQRSSFPDGKDEEAVPSPERAFLDALQAVSALEWAVREMMDHAAFSKNTGSVREVMDKLSETARSYDEIREHLRTLSAEE